MSTAVTYDIRFSALIVSREASASLMPAYSKQKRRTASGPQAAQRNSVPPKQKQRPAARLSHLAAASRTLINAEMEPKFHSFR
jgi:hypothetical protein